jgi:twitching motility two-component system response regulator PilG
MVNSLSTISSSSVVSEFASALTKSDQAITPMKALQNIVRREVTGRLTVREAQGAIPCLRLYVGQGQLHYATGLVGDRERLLYCLHRIQPSAVQAVPYSLESSAYNWLCQHWQQGVLSLSTLRTMLQAMSQEALVQLLMLPQAIFQLDRKIGLDPILISSSLKTTIAPLAKQVHHWQALQPHFHSPLQRLYLAHSDRLKDSDAIVFQSVCGPQAQTTSLKALQHSLCLYELAVQLDSDPLQLAQTFFPLIAEGVLTVRPYVRAKQTIRPTIVCVDDSSTVQHLVRIMLKDSGYRVVSITNPLQALSCCMEEEPDLIFLDITMPNLDGYNLCRLLRQCNILKETPIVMLTGRDTMVDKVRARFLGATSYLTKPFEAKDLTEVIAKYVEQP